MKKYIQLSLFTAFFFISLINSAFSCDFCLVSQGISPLETVQGAGVKISQRYTLLNSVFKGTEEISNPGAKEEFWTTELTGFYGVTENVMLLAIIPLKKTKLTGHLHVHEDGEVEAHPDKGEETGLGDMALLGRYTFFTSHTLDTSSAAAALLGIKFPTGKTDGRTDDGAEFLDAHVQLGTGSTDYLLGLSATHVVRRFTLSANLLGAITTEGEVGDTKHQFGNSLNYDLTAKYRVSPGVIAPAASQVFAALSVNGEARRKEEEGGVKLANSGGHTIYLSPAIQAIVAPRWVFELSYQHALYHNLNGIQLGEDYKVNGGVTYLF